MLILDFDKNIGGNMSHNKYIVFGGEHYNPLGIIRSLGEHGVRPIAIIIKGNQVLTSKSKYISILHLVDSIEAGYQLLVEKYSNLNEKCFLYTSDDNVTSYLDQHYDEIKNKFIFFNAGVKERITYYMNKENINNLARKHGLNVLDTVVVNKGEIPKDIEYPIITKSIASTIGGWKNDVFICRSEEELRSAYDTIQSPVVLIQKYITKENELCLDGMSINNGKQVMYAIASNYNYILPNTYSSYMTVFNFKDAELKSKLNAMFEEIGFEGIFSVEFLVAPDGKLYFCEINFRNSTWSYASTCAGMNLPVLWAESMMKGEISNQAEKEIPSGFTAMVELSDFRVRVLGKKISFVKWLAEAKATKCKFYINKNDMRPVFSMLFSKLKR